MTFDQLKRYGSDFAGPNGWFLFLGCRFDASRIFKHDDSLFVVYRGGVEIGQLAPGDLLVIEDDNSVRTCSHANFHATYERSV